MPVALDHVLGSKVGAFDQTVTVAAAVPAGRVIVVGVASDTVSPQSLSISDSKANSWTLLPGTTTTDGVTSAIFLTLVTNALTTANTITCSSSNYGGFGGLYVGLVAASFTGVGVTGYGGSVLANSIANPLAVTSSAPVGAGNLAFTVAHRNGNLGLPGAPGGAWTLLGSATVNGLNLAAYYQVPGSTGTLTASFANSPGGSPGIPGGASIGGLTSGGTNHLTMLI